ncbi:MULTISPECIES: sulfatase-like hydrolase/transferase [unclassified Lentimonas]|uniref:sulfatase-like hydrolase/transferase n=1 Tax=unclassified Lentimonas TaxID=2630993 RepID=UPI001328BC0D|nr:MULTISPECIES: sulfatase-like hydrolase/transferase [unclassified Lentimonas]CAA6692115.1 Choline-sulfatase (EC [Lentimonas sp. CC19]CAA6694516.1 Choline-sulfatase (EC [Lentimonas sp. CC10]CAA7070632.1 Choline-sulfatase (EC [Lentimonas sp. CC11]
MKKYFPFLVVLGLLANPVFGQIKVAIHGAPETEADPDSVAGMSSQPSGSVVVTSIEVWNNFVGTPATTTASLVDVNGAATSATFTSTAGFVWVSNGDDWESNTQDWVMMDGWVGLVESESIIVADLPAEYAAGYSVILYGDSNRIRQMDYSIDDGTVVRSSTIQDAGTFSGTFADGVNTVVLEGLTGTGFTLTGNESGGRSAVNGFEIIPAAVAINSISVNFHVGNDSDNQAEHELASGEIAGLSAFATDQWNNISIGDGGMSTGALFPSTALADASGNSNVATIAPSESSSRFGGYAASAAATANELGLSVDDDNLFNSYLGLGSDDTAVLNISGLGSAYTDDGYTLILYSDSDRRGSSSSSRTSQFVITPEGGSAITVFVEDDDISDDSYNVFDGTYIESDGVNDGTEHSNYVVVPNLTAASFEIAISSPDGGRGAISGFQIIPGGIEVPILPEVNSFAVDDGYVAAGETAPLSWSSTGATTLTLDPGGHDVTGATSWQITPATTTTYTLTATNEDGHASSDLEVVAGPARPNILLCLVDDWGVMDTSEPFSYDSYTDGAEPVRRAFNDFYQTPNMEQLADDGMKFTQAYALPVCSPTRTSLMTGFNGPRHAVTVHISLYGNYERPSGSNVSTHRSANGWRHRGMEVTDITLPKLLSAQGYRSIHAGKGHFGARGDATEDPREIGFDINLGGSGAGSPGNYVGNPDFSSNDNPVPYIEDYHGNGVWLTDALTEAMTDAIDDAVDDGVPFFAYMSYYAVHATFTTNPNATGDYSDAASTNHGKFASMVEGVDTSLGQLRAHLEAMEPGVAENTLIILLGDNGSDSPALRSGLQINNDFSDYPIRGKKANCYEGGYHVPLFVAWAKADPYNVFQQQLPITPNTVEHDIVSAPDITTTILSVAGVDHPYMDGVDLSPYLTSTPGTHRKQTLLRHQPNSQNSSFFTAYRRDDYKLIYFYYKNGGAEFELYDLAADRSETNNLAGSNPELVLQLAREMAAALDNGWGEYGALWPTLAINPSTGESLASNDAGDDYRPLNDDPFLIDFAVNGYDSVDSDEDGLLDALEDADGDGLVGLNETNADDEDTDDDGTDDYTERRLNLDPRDANSHFAVRVASTGSESLDLAWPSAPGLSFNVRSSDDLSTPVEDWEALFENVAADASLSETIKDVPIDGDKAFFSVELLP